LTFRSDIEFASSAFIIKAILTFIKVTQQNEKWGEAMTFPSMSSPGHEFIVGRSNFSNGSRPCCTVVAVGSDVKKFKVGDIAGVGCFVDSCGTCEYCLDGNDHWCLDNSAYTYNGMERDGVTPTYGGYSKNVVVKG
jgi:alcohol dehydrogenase (NADP+)